ncbi:MAG: hypothetical protein NC218_04695, partial [Acetobacter sp.]|nr:hypothetical protein [Acetobacter sp.]
TIDWSECEVLLTALAKESLGRPRKGKVNNFSDFIRAYAAIDLKTMESFLRDNGRRLLWSDNTSVALISEDACLFSCEPASALEIVLRHLDTLNTGGKLPALWCFLDEEKRAVVHFVNHKGWYAEVYCSCSENFSVLHLIDDEVRDVFVPVVFAEDISHFISLAEANGSYCLQKYLPRVTHDFLSNKSGKKKDKRSTSADAAKIFTNNDAGDLL